MGGTYIIGKRYLYALSFDSEESGSSKTNSQKQSNDGAYRVCSTFIVYTYRVGFGVARL